MASKIKTKRAYINRELKDILASEKKLFRFASDRADDASYWKGARVYWITNAAGVKVGRVDVAPHMRFTDGEDWSRAEGWLYVQSFALYGKLKEDRFREIGSAVITWLTEYAVVHGLTGISTNERQTNNAKLVELYQSFGFKEVRTIPDYFEGPEELCVVLECEW